MKNRYSIVVMQILVGDCFMIEKMIVTTVHYYFHDCGHRCDNGDDDYDSDYADDDNDYNDYDYFSNFILFNNITYYNCTLLFTKVVYKWLVQCKHINYSQVPNNNEHNKAP